MRGLTSSIDCSCSSFEFRPLIFLRGAGRTRAGLGVPGLRPPRNQTSAVPPTAPSDGGCDASGLGVCPTLPHEVVALLYLRHYLIRRDLGFIIEAQPALSPRHGGGSCQGRFRRAKLSEKHQEGRGGGKGSDTEKDEDTRGGGERLNKRVGLSVLYLMAAWRISRKDEGNGKLAIST